MNSLKRVFSIILQIPCPGNAFIIPLRKNLCSLTHDRSAFPVATQNLFLSSNDWNRITGSGNMAVPVQCRSSLQRFSTSRFVMDIPAAYAGSPSLRTRMWDHWLKAKEAVSFFWQRKPLLKNAGFVMYSCCTDPVNHVGFFKFLEMPDTFNSWFKVTELHVWMCAVRLSVESAQGKFVRNEIVKNFWKDVDNRSMRLSDAALLNRKKSINELGDQFRANMFAYDEGFLRDDKVLASAIWRNFYARQCDDPRKIELVVYYIRTQMDNLENQDRYNLLRRGIIKWVPLSEVK